MGYQLDSRPPLTHSTWRFFSGKNHGKKMKTSPQNPWKMLGNPDCKWEHLLDYHGTNWIIFNELSWFSQVCVMFSSYKDPTT